jgi:hypothetical protein
MESSLRPDDKYFQHRHLWVLLPGLPLQLWNEGALAAIGNSLGTFITVDRLTLSAPNRKMGKILVEMDIHGGLPELLEIEWRGRRILQKLDYLGIPFRCSLCCSTGHLRRDCSGWVEEEVSEDTTLHRDNGGSSPEADSVWVGTQYFSPEVPSSPEPLDSLSGKLKRHCPALYSSLSLWEKDTLDASIFLKVFISTVAVSSDVDREVTEPIYGFSLFTRTVNPIFLGVGGWIPCKSTTCLGTLQFWRCSLTLPRVLSNLFSLVTSPPMAIPLSEESTPLPGCREIEEDDTSLSVVLDSLIPFLRDTNPPVQLPTYFGNCGL